MAYTSHINTMQKPSTLILCTQIHYMHTIHTETFCKWTSHIHIHHTQIVQTLHPQTKPTFISIVYNDTCGQTAHTTSRTHLLPSVPHRPQAFTLSSITVTLQQSQTAHHTIHTFSFLVSLQVMPTSFHNVFLFPFLVKSL